MKFIPGYIELFQNGSLEQKSDLLLKRFESCTLCPRKCKVNRLKGETGICRTGRYAWVCSAHAHFGEEPPLVGFYGSGTIFFTNCNLMCSFCQNFEISHLGEGQQVQPAELAAHMLALQRSGCHNINFVTPSHVLPQIMESLCIAADQGLSIPLVFNSGAYDDPETIQHFEGVFDIYMPDLKFLNPQLSAETCNAPDYPKWAKSSIKEMHRQVGDLVIDINNIANRGLIIRHLLMPGQFEDTKKILDFIAEEISPHSYVNVMPQYYPCGGISKHPVLGRRITRQEYDQATSYALQLGLRLAD